MKLVLIYGPPGVGKLTVANELAKITGYKVYHNHLAIESILPVFDFGTKEYNSLIAKYRLEMIKTAARSPLPGLIATFVYAPGIDDKYLSVINGYITKHNGEMLAVRLSCSRPELYRRIKSRSRKKYSKITSPEKLKMFMSEHDLSAPMRTFKSISIDNTKKTPEQVAGMIKAKYNL